MDFYFKFKFDVLLLGIDPLGNFIKNGQLILIVNFKLNRDYSVGSLPFQSVNIQFFKLA